MSRSYMFDDRTQENRRKQREEAQVEIRQLKKEELLNKKRSLSLAVSQISNFSEMRERLYSNDLTVLHQGTYEFRSLLSVEGNPPVQAVIDSGCLPRFVEILNKEYVSSLGDNKELVDKTRIESAWVLTNIAAGTSEQTLSVLKAGALPLLVSMLYEPNETVIDQSVWALGNIAGDSEHARDCIIKTGALDILISLLEKYYTRESQIKLVRNMTWLLSNLNRGRNPPPKLSDMHKSLQILFKLINVRDSEIVCDSFWALSYIVDVESGCTDIVLGSNVMPKAYNCLEAYCAKLKNATHDPQDANIAAMSVSPIIRMLGNIATGNDNQTNALIKMGFLEFFGVLFYRIENKKSQRLRKEICWTLSNITAGPVEQVSQVVECDLIPMLIDAMNSYEPFIRKEACWALSNALFHCVNKLEWVQVFIDSGLIESLVSYLEIAGNLVDMQSHILDCFLYILEGGRKYEQKFGRNIVTERMSETEAVGCIEYLQDSESIEVSDKAYKIIVEHFDGVEN
ncbi:importin subunit alpha-1 [Vairimorpha necatrix]|uniref:Importin subunit alpha n=1 Tax=Vairimorpha necatrix TaxID=6039 RepID=A0AAX4JA34_9MICR